jgi:glycosyltransferase involved in cell wall biosynthesis
MYMQNILYIVTQPIFGGAQKYVHDLALSLVKTGRFTVQVAIGYAKNTGDQAWLSDLKKERIKIWQLYHLRRRLSVWHDVLAFFELIKLYRNSRPSIIHLNSSKAGALGAVAAFFYPHASVVYTIHGLVLNEPLNLGRKIYYWLAELFSAKFKDAIICVSKFDEQSVLKWHVAPLHKIRVIYNGLDYTTLNLLARPDARYKLKQIMINQISDSGLDQDLVLIGTIAGLFKTKGLTYLIKAAQIVISDNSDRKIKFIIIGDGPDRQFLTNLISSYRLEGYVYLVGAVKAASQYLPGLDIFVLSSVKEGLPYTILEAKAAGRPIVATRVGGVPELIEADKSGLTVEPKTVDQLARAINTLLEDKNLAVRLSKTAAADAGEFTLNSMVNKTIALYSALNKA